MRRLQLATPLATVTLALALTVGLGVAAVPIASGDPGGGTGDGAGAYPSQDQVDRAKARAERTAHDVGAIKGRLLLANQRLDEANLRAEQASEAYNGAMWHLEQARVAYRQARADAANARRTVAAQRDRIGGLVAQSYQNGGDLTALNAMMSADGPEGVLDQYTAFQGASTALQADYQRFAATESLAQVFESKARHAKAEQVALAAKAEEAKAAATASADAAQSEASRIAAEKDQLIRALAQAQHISVDLARQRQSALEEIARKRAEARARAEAAAQAKAAAEAAARQQAADEAAARKKAAEEAAAAQQAEKAAGAEEGRADQHADPEAGPHARAADAPDAPDTPDTPDAADAADAPGTAGTEWRDRRSARLRQGAARRALPVGRHGARLVGLLRPHYAGLGRRGPVAAALLGRAVRRRHPDPGRGRPGGRPAVLELERPAQRHPPRRARPRWGELPRGPAHRRERPLQLDLRVVPGLRGAPVTPCDTVHGLSPASGGNMRAWPTTTSSMSLR